MFVRVPIKDENPTTSKPIWPLEFILAKKFFVVSVSSGWFRRLRGKLSSWTFRREGFGVSVSAYRFRRTSFGVPVVATSNCPVWTHCIVFFGNDTLSSLEKTEWPPWREHNVHFANDTMSPLDMTQCPLWTRHSVLSGHDKMSSLETTQCPLWKRHHVLFGKAHCPRWKRHIVLVGKDTQSSLEKNTMSSLEGFTSVERCRWFLSPCTDPLFAVSEASNPAFAKPICAICDVANSVVDIANPIRNFANAVHSDVNAINLRCPGRGIWSPRQWRV